eukprot:g19920.t1
MGTAAFAATKGSRRPSIAESDLVLCLQEGLQGLQDLQGLEPDVTPDADDTMTLEAQGRLQVRLGALDTLKLITGEELHDTTVALGLTSYSIEESFSRRSAKKGDERALMCPTGNTWTALKRAGLSISGRKLSTPNLFHLISNL